MNILAFLTYFSQAILNSSSTNFTPLMCKVIRTNYYDDKVTLTIYKDPYNNIKGRLLVNNKLLAFSMEKPEEPINEFGNLKFETKRKKISANGDKISSWWVSIETNGECFLTIHEKSIASHLGLESNVTKLHLDRHSLNTFEEEKNDDVISIPPIALKE